MPDIRTLMSQFDEIDFSYVFRSANETAHVISIVVPFFNG